MEYAKKQRIRKGINFFFSQKNREISNKETAKFCRNPLIAIEKQPIVKYKVKLVNTSSEYLKKTKTIEKQVIAERKKR